MAYGAAGINPYSLEKHANCHSSIEFDDGGAGILKTLLLSDCHDLSRHDFL